MRTYKITQVGQMFYAKFYLNDNLMEVTKAYPCREKLEDMIAEKKEDYVEVS